MSKQQASKRSRTARKQAKFSGLRKTVGHASHIPARGNYVPFRSR